MKFADHSFPKDARFGNNLSCSFQEVKNVQRIDINGAICHMSDSGDLLVFFPTSFVSSCLPFQNYNQVIIFDSKHFQVKRNQNFEIDYHNYHPKANMGIIITYLLCAKIIDFIV